MAENENRAAVAVADQKSEGATAAKLAAEIGRVHRADVKNGRPFFLVPEGATQKFIGPEEQDMAPHRKYGTVNLTDVESFTAFVRDQQADITGHYRSRIYATETPPKFEAVLNDVGDNPSFRDYRAVYAPVFSPEWMTWTENNKKGRAQEEFAQFIEDNVLDIVNPDGATLMEIILAFEASRSGSFKSHVRLDNGSINFAWVDQNDAKSKGTIQVPSTFELFIPVFYKRPAVRVDARLRYRLREERLTLWYELVRPHVIVRNAFDELRSAIEQETPGIPLLMGTAG